MRLSCTLTEILGLKDKKNQEFDLLGSRDVIGHVTIGLGVGTFLLVVNDDHAEIRGFKNFGVTSLIFSGHVTSSVT